jgi:hypothetical protein
LELVQVWTDVSRAQPAPFRVLAWNWEWAYWYADPQAEIVTRLPEGAALLVDLEIGGTRRWGRRLNYIGEYSLGYTGPGQRFVATGEAAARCGIPVHAKIQLDNTHEMCSVPNLPLIHNLHAKLAALVEHAAAGFMGCWTIGCQFTLNTFALKLFLRDPQRFLARSEFVEELARAYFGLPEGRNLDRAWGFFCEAFARYPFSVRMLYFGPHNDAPARPLSLRYEGKPTGRSFGPDPLGDDLGHHCVGEATCDRESFTLAEILEGFEHMCQSWERGLPHYEAALSAPGPGVSDEHRHHREEEVRCAQMIGIQLRSTSNAFRFYREQRRVMDERQLDPPCALPVSERLRQIMHEEIANAERAIPLCEADPRLGWHEEFHGYKYNAVMIRAKIRAMQGELAAAV